MVLIVAHRGAPTRAHENTIESFLAAVELGAEMVELDIRKTADGVLVVFHDPWLTRRAKKHPIAETTYEEINKLAAAKRFRVPTAEEAFSALAGKVMLDIEIKEPGYEHQLLAAAQRHFPVDRFVCASFLPGVLSTIKTASPETTTGFICGDAAQLPLCDTVAADVIAPDKSLFADQRKLFADLNKRGKKIAVWTVDDSKTLSALFIDPIVEAVITNHADRALALRKKICNA